MIILKMKKPNDLRIQPLVSRVLILFIFKKNYIYGSRYLKYLRQKI